MHRGLLDDTVKKINSDETKPLNILIKERVNTSSTPLNRLISSLQSTVNTIVNTLKPSSTGVGATIFEMPNKGGSGSGDYYSVSAKFIAPKSGIYIYSITQNDSGASGSTYYINTNANVYFNYTIGNTFKKDGVATEYIGACNRNASADFYFYVEAGTPIVILGGGQGSSSNSLTKNRVTYEP